MSGQQAEQVIYYLQQIWQEIGMLHEELLNGEIGGSSAVFVDPYVMIGGCVMLVGGCIVGWLAGKELLSIWKS